MDMIYGISKSKDILLSSIAGTLDENIKRRIQLIDFEGIDKVVDLLNERIQKSLGYLTPIQYKEKELERIKKEKVL